MRDDFFAALLDDLLEAFFALDAERLRPRDDLDAVAIALLLDDEDTVGAAHGHERASARFARTDGNCKRHSVISTSVIRNFGHADSWTGRFRSHTITPISLRESTIV